MGYWGYFVVGRDERPLAERDALAGARGMTLRTSAPGGWQVWEYPSGDGGIGNMNDLARETGAPALFGYVMDSACVVVEAAAPESGAWTTCLARSAMAGYLGAPAADGTDGADGVEGAEGVVQNGLTLEDYFLEPRDAADRARRVGRRGRTRRVRGGTGRGADRRPRSFPTPGSARAGASPGRKLILQTARRGSASSPCDIPGPSHRKERAASVSVRGP
ncbi:hypothetical protein SHIRM173S_06559 [Streptomyces hirsutus]